MSFSAKFYYFPGNHLGDLPENVFKWLQRDYDIDRRSPCDEVPDELKDRSLFVVENNGDIVFVHWDGGGSEDDSFVCGLCWIDFVVTKAYILGKLSVEEFDEHQNL